MGQLRPQLSDKDLAQIEPRLDANMAKAERISKCGREKKARYRDAMAPPQVAEAVAPSQGPSNNILQPAPCPPERLKLARRYQNVGGVEYHLRAMELCPLEMCYLGKRIVEIAPTNYGMRVMRLCPHL
jgi:hypothetical protein